MASPAFLGRALAGKIVHWTIFFFLLAQCAGYKQNIALTGGDSEN
jgi:hypothetical protein